MTTTNKNWWLYGNDIELARVLQWEKINNEHEKKRKIDEISVTTYLGDYKKCENEIISQRLFSETIGRQALFRARRGTQSNIAWSSLMKGLQKERLQERELDKIFQMGIEICVELVGGIGDQLEAASVLLDQYENSKTSKRLDIRVKASGHERIVVENYLIKSRIRHMLKMGTSKSEVNVTYPMFRCWEEKKGTKKLEYAQLKNIKTVKQNKESIHILVCWRCKVDKLNLLSSFSRSIPFPEILKLMDYWKTKIQERSATIYDITKYNAEEKEILGKNFSNIYQLGDSIKNLDNTIELMEKSDKIISVDTSLLHICATCNRNVYGLLPLYSDERWHELIENEGVYKNNVITIRQEQYNDWKMPLEKIAKIIGS